MLAHQISDYWRSSYGGNERTCLKDLIVVIYNQIPQDHSLTRHYFKSMLDSLFHTAPEILGKVWVEIYSFLQNTIPLNETNPQWIENIKTAWEEANSRRENEFNSRSFGTEKMKENSGA